jgi:hypothetical protein
MTEFSPFPYSDSDVASLRQALLHGDAEAKRLAIEHAVALGPRAMPLVPVIAKQLRQGFRIATSQAVDLLYVVPDPDLYRAAVEAGVLTHLGLHDKSRLLVLGFGDYEEELCTYIYRNWANPTDPMVGLSIKAFEQAGTSQGRETLVAILPELSESVNIAAYDDLDIASRSDRLTHSEQRALQQRLEQIHVAIGAIDLREQRG